MMVHCVEQRFGATRAPHPVQSSRSPSRVCGPRFGRTPGDVRASKAQRVSVTLFIGNRRAAHRFFCPSQVERLLEDLVLHRLAAEPPFEIAHPFFQPAQLGWHDVIIGATASRPPSLISRLLSSVLRFSLIMGFENSLVGILANHSAGASPG
jgi:hypothetical protein